MTNTQTTTRVPKWLRILLPAALILVWLAAAGMGGPKFGQISEVSSNDSTAYLPDSADATAVQRELSRFSGDSAIPAIVVFTSETALTEAQLDTIGQTLEQAKTLDGVLPDLSPAIPSTDGKAAHAFVPIDTSGDIATTVVALSDLLAKQAPEGVSTYVTGPAGFSADLKAGFSGIDGLLLIVALVAVFLILILVYRSLLLPVVVLMTSMFALCTALLTVWWLAKFEILMLSGQTQGILFILVIGAATDYSLLFVARFREELRGTKTKDRALVQAWKGSVEPILASGGTVIAGLLCLLLSDLKSNSSLGPVASIGIVFAMLAALTLLPALLYTFGRAAYWPRRPHYDPAAVEAEHGMPQKGLWAWLARVVKRRPRAIWVATTLVLLIGAVGVTQLKADGVAQSDLVLGASEARDGQRALGEHFPGGSGSPIYVLTPEAKLQDVADVLLGHDGIDGVSVSARDSVTGTATVTADGLVAQGPPGTTAPDPTVVDGKVLLQATLTSAADSAAAADTVRDVRTQLDGSGALVGGVTATAIDTNDASIHDRNLIIPLILVVILLILMLLLRSILAPVLLVVTTVISFGTALGVSALVFNGIFDFPGADPAVPLYGFVFLVALGIDYNIFLMTRVREESLAHGTREGVLRGLGITGGVITSAGLVLAATFAALAVIPILFLAQLAFIVAFGVLLDTFIVRTLLVPALAYDLGRTLWWPSALSRRPE